MALVLTGAEPLTDLSPTPAEVGPPSVPGSNSLAKTVTLPRIPPTRGYVGLLLVMVGLFALAIALLPSNRSPSGPLLAAFAVGFLAVLSGGALMGYVHGRQPPRPRRRRSAGPH